MIHRTESPETGDKQPGAGDEAHAINLIRLDCDMSSEQKPDATRQRIIESAVKAFAEFGYERATIRLITDRAKANMAAVNYYFGDKFQLYREILQTTVIHTCERLQQSCSSGKPEEQVHRFVRGILHLDEDTGDFWAHLLMVREVLELHEGSDQVIVEAARPLHQLAEEIVGNLLGNKVSKDRIRLSASLMISTCVNRIFQRRLDARMYPGSNSTEAREEPVELIYQFVLMGILGVSKSNIAFSRTIKELKG
jgi:TetR/AcrR family transcriptional regulator, regulator of cefoperazone and chloramphenicol sensitivity